MVLYFRTLIRGNDIFWVILVTDAGLVTKPSRAGVNVVSLEDVCVSEHCLLLHTKSGEYLLQRDETTGTISTVQPTPELRTRQAHTIVLSRLVRNINEQAHAGMKQKVGLLGARKIPRQFLFPLGSKLGTRFGIRQEDHHLPRLSIITCVGVGIYNTIHPGFSIRFLNADSQLALAQIYCSRINLENPMDYNLSWNCRLDRNSGSGFQSLTVRDLGINNNLGFPVLPQELFNPLVFDVTGGPAPIIGASAILSYMSFRMIKEQNPDFTVSEVQEAIRLSEDISLQYFVQQNPPEGWNERLMGEFKTCTLVRLRCPPSHKSDSSPANWKFAVVAFSEAPDGRLSIRGPLSQLLFWGCYGCPSDMGLMRTCKHVASLLMILSFQYAFVPKTLSVSLLNPKGAPGSQTTHILPETGIGGWHDESLGSTRICRDTRRNNILYGARRNTDGSSQSSTEFSVPQAPQNVPQPSQESTLPPTLPTASITPPTASAPPEPSVTPPITTSPPGPSVVPPTDTPLYSQPPPTHSYLTDDQELYQLLNTIDENNHFLIPNHSCYVRAEDFSFNELQQRGLLNPTGTFCYMNSVLLLLHRMRIQVNILDNEYCHSSVTRSYTRSMITKLTRVALQALPSTQAFSIRNMIVGWQHIGLQPLVHLGVSEDAQEVLSALLNSLLLKSSRADSEQPLTKFRGHLACQNTRDCSDHEFADFFDGQVDVSPFIHVIGVESDENPIQIREKLRNFMNSTFISKCQAIMCRKRLKDAKIKVEPGRFTILALNRNIDNRSKAMGKVNLADDYPAVNAISQEPVAVISHVGSMASGHYIMYSSVGGQWFLNDDSKNIIQCRFSPFDQQYLCNETADIIVFENKP